LSEFPKTILWTTNAHDNVSNRHWSFYSYVMD